MRFIATVFALVLAATAFADQATAQSPLVVDPGTPLDAVIHGDTDRPADRVYVLQRGETYVYNNMINTGWDGNADMCGESYHLRVEAEEGDGPRPLIQGEATSGDEADRPFLVCGDFTLKGVYLIGIDAAGAYTDNAFVRSRAPVTITVDDVIFDRQRQSVIRTDSAGASIYMTNSVATNIYDARPGDIRLEQSYVFQLRGQPLDTLVSVNNTFYNNTNSVINGVNTIDYARIEHNTIVNQLGVGETPVNFGPTQEAIFRNNILVNVGSYGVAPTADAGIVAIDSVLVEGEMMAPQIDFRNNLFYQNPDIAAVYPDDIVAPAMFDSTTLALVEAQGTLNTMIEGEPITFENHPDPLTELISADYQNMPVDAFLPAPPGFVEPNFAYPEDHMAYTASTAGQPLGALNWFGLDIIETAADGGVELPESVVLRGNFPNPFNPSTTIRFDLSRAASVGVTVFDVLGRSVLEIPETQMAPAAGQQIRVDAGNLPSGIYMYQLRARTGAETIVRTGSMVLMK